MYGLRTPKGGGCLLTTNEQVNPNADPLDKVNMNDTTTTCPECDRVFDLTEETNSAEWHYGHDCEA